MAMSSAGATSSSPPGASRPSRYESQKRRDWQTFTQYLRAHRPPLALARCSGAHVLEFLRYLDRFGKTRVHAPPCPSYGAPAGPACQCPLRQAWGSLDALVGRLRAAFDERHGPGAEAANPFAARAVRLYLRGVRDAQAAARGISYHKKKKRTGKGKAKAKSTQLEGNVNDIAGYVPTNNDTPVTVAAVQPLHPPPSTQPCVNGAPFECYDLGSLVGANGGWCGGFYLPMLFDTTFY